jgi:hypothetical protein
VTLPPFRSTSQRFYIGDLQPGRAAVARLSAAVDDKAAVREYRLACEIVHDNQTAMVSLPVLLKKSPEFFPGVYAIAVSSFAIAGGIALLWLRKRLGRTSRGRKKWL